MRFDELPPEIQKNPKAYYEDYSGFWLAGLLALILSVLFAVPVFDSRYVMFSNDGPLGGMVSDAARINPADSRWDWVWVLGAWVFLLIPVAAWCLWLYSERWTIRPEYWPLPNANEPVDHGSIWEGWGLKIWAGIMFAVMVLLIVNMPR